MMDNRFQELAVIGCFIQTDCQGQILDEVTPDDFSDPDLADLFKKLIETWQRMGRMDAVLAQCADCKDLILESAEAPVSYRAWQSYCKAVHEAATVRRVQMLGLQLASGVLAAGEASDIADKLNSILTRRRGLRSETAKEGIFGFVMRQTGKPPDYIRTGMARLDRYTRFEKGDMVVIGARPSNGKTAFSIQLGLAMAKAGRKVVFFSLETSVEKIMDRAVTNFYGLNFSDVKDCKIYSEEYEDFTIDTDRFYNLPFEVVEASGRTVGWIKSEAIRRKADVAIVDYLGLVRGQGKSRYEQVTQISLDFHTAAQETKTLFIVLSQLRRPENATEKIPSIQDLRESGQVEQDAECVILLHYADRETGEFVVRVGKNKEGLVGDLPFRFEADRQRFLEVDNG